MNLPLLELASESSLLGLLERDFRSWLEADPQAPLPPVLEQVWERAVLDPAQAFLGRPGKHFRPRLVATSWALAGGDPAALPDDLPLCVEVLHAGSLIVDDIEDDAGRRRGAPALHRICGVPLAINTGNLFYCWSLDLLSRLGLPPDRELALHRRTARAMLLSHQGQALDLSVRVHELPRHAIPPLVRSATRLKAGALMELAAALGAVAAGADEERARTLSDFGRALGVALQMLDDLSGVLNPGRRDKAREDLRLARPTWVWSWLARDVDEAEFARLAGLLSAVAEGADPEVLIAVLAERLADTGPARVHRHLHSALRNLRVSLGPSPHLAALQAEVERLEHSYV